MNKKDETIFNKKVVDSTLWILIPKVLGSIFITSALILLIFWLSFGELSYFSFSFTFSLAVLQILIVLGLRFQDRTDLHASKPLKNNWLDKIGGFWLLACALGALGGWIFNQLAFGYPFFSLYFQILSFCFTIVLPIFTMLPNLRYLETKVLYIQLPLLFFVTTLPILVGINPAFSLFNRLLN